MDIPIHIQDFWNRYLESTSNPQDANSRFFESFKIGSTAAQADSGVELILSGEKTATSSLLWEYEVEGRSIPSIGSLSVVEGGDSQPICVVKTIWVNVIPISEIDESFAIDYSETNGTVDGWHRAFDEYYSRICSELGREFSVDTPLVCERFEVSYSEGSR